MIGTLGPVTFVVSARNIRTFTDLSLSHSAKYSEHSITGKKGLLEFVGFGVDSVSMTIRLAYEYGIKPMEELRTLRKMFVNRVVFNFVLDGQPVGDNMWVLTDLNEKLEQFTNDGKLRSATVDVKLKEYVQLDEEK